MTNESEKSNSQNSIGILVLIIIIGFLAYRYVEKQVGTFDTRKATSAKFWPVPTTQLGQAIQTIDKKIVLNAPSGQAPSYVAMFHEGTKRTIPFLNGTRKYWPAALVLLVGSVTYLLRLLFWTRRKDTHFRIYGFILLVGVLGSLGHFAWAPINPPWYIKVTSILFYAIGLFTVALSFIHSWNPLQKDAKRTVQYGPKFSEPTLNGAGSIHIATYERDVLPDGSRWSAKRGWWPIEIPVKKLSSGITILGEKGSGKSRLMFGIHDEIRAKYPNVPILIHDPKGEWYRTYFNESTDVVFGPNINGSSTWDIWGDLKKYPEMLHGVINTAVYAHPSNGDTFWMDNAVRLLENAFSSPTLEEARGYLIAKKEANIDDKMFLSIYGTAKLALHDIAKVALAKPQIDPPGTPTSIDDYLQWKGRILLLNNPAFAAEQRGAFSLFISAFLLRALSLPDVPAGQLRLVAFIDEALTFTLPPEVEKLIYTQCRSKGIVIIAGAQRLPDRNLKESGEWATAENIFAMKVLNLDTQAQLSKRGGDISYEEKSKSKQRDQIGHEKGASEVSHSRTHAALPAEIFGRLGTRECILYHDEGIAPCRTNMVKREQRDIQVPGYAARMDVTEFMKKLD